MGERHDPREATIVVAASGSDTLSADYRCSGAADDVEINAALADAGVDGKVILLDGTYTLADPIIFTNNNQTLQGMGEGTFINGDGLATTEHAIQIDAKTGCKVCDLSIQTADGGVNTIHCIYINDGADDTEICGVKIVNSESDGIHVAGTTTYNVHIHNCHIVDADNHGIYVGMDNNNSCLRIHINDCYILDCGEEGIQLASPTGTGTNNWATIEKNVVYQAGADGIEFASADNCIIEGNLVLDCTTNGILGTNCDESVVKGNVVWSCGYNGITFGGNSVSDAITGNVCIDNGADGSYAGINTSTVSYMTIVGNVCYNNRKYGIAFGVSGTGGNNITGNHCYFNYEDGIIGGGPDSIVSSNICYNNSQGAAETDHGITLTNNCARCLVIGNWCSDDGTNQEDGIHLESGAVSVLIKGNYCYNNMGAGIALAANNTDCVVDDNFCNENDDSGIEVLAGCSRSSISGNSCLSNLLHGITCSSPQCKIDNNLIVGNGTASAGTYHGIYLANTAADRCSVSGNVIHDAGSITENGIHLVDGVEGCQINGNYIYNLMGDGIMLTDNNHYSQVNDNHIEDVDDNGIYLLGCDYCTIDGNLIDNPGANGIRVLTYSRWCIINNNHVRSAAVEGIEVNGSSVYATINGNNCVGNTGGAGIYLTGESEFTTVTGNNCQGNSDGIYVEQCDNSTVTGNNCSGNTNDGIAIDDTQDTAVSGNTCIDNDSGGSTSNGIHLSGCMRCSVTGNVCDSNGLHGIYCQDTEYCVLTGNSCCTSYTGDGIHLAGASPGVCDNNTLTGNVCTANANDGIDIEGGANADRNIVVANNLLANNGTNLVDNGVNTQIGHNITA